MIEAHQAGMRRRREAVAAKSAASRRRNRRGWSFPWQHVLETVIDLVPHSNSADSFLRRVRRLGANCPPAALLAALRMANDLIDLTPRPGRQMIRGVVASRKTVRSPWGDCNREVWTIDTDRGANLYGTVPPSMLHLGIGARVEFRADVQPGYYKYWRPKA